MTASLAPGTPQAPPAPEGGSVDTMIEMKHLAERTTQNDKPTR